MRFTPMLLMPLLIAGCHSTPEPGSAKAPSDASGETADIAPLSTNLPTTTLAAFRARARQFKGVIALPTLETAPGEIKNSVSNTIARANLSLGEIASCRHDLLSHANTAGALGWDKGNSPEYHGFGASRGANSGSTKWQT